MEDFKFFLRANVLEILNIKFEEYAFDEYSKVQRILYLFYIILLNISFIKNKLYCFYT